jgi:hypothetical protein
MGAHQFFKTRKLIQDFRCELKMFKSTLGKGLAFAKTKPAFVNLWIISMIGKNY